MGKHYNIRFGFVTPSKTPNSSSSIYSQPIRPSALAAAAAAKTPNKKSKPYKNKNHTTGRQTPLDHNKNTAP
tara:strand:- start:14 stop:229 length:216 start_codon:yes stop_codon:yes gene_type:complete